MGAVGMDQEEDKGDLQRQQHELTQHIHFDGTETLDKRMFPYSPTSLIETLKVVFAEVLQQQRQRNLLVMIR